MHWSHMATLRAAIIIDYQNVHLTGHDLFAKHLPRHETLIDPLHFARQLIRARNLAQRPGMEHVSLSRVLVYRGLPSSEHDDKGHARNQAQKAQWERDPCVTVQLRPLKYEYEYDSNGNVLTDENGQRIVKGKREKGVDVLCALALVREALKPDTDVVILASHDSDLEPALDEALALQCVKVETFCWFDPSQPRRTRQLRPAHKTVWNTRLGATEFCNCWDLADYS